MSLRDQLLKAGLANKKQVKRAEAAQRKQEHGEFKGKRDALLEKEQREKDREIIEREKEAKREQDQQLNRELEAKRKQHEDQFRCRMLLRSQGRSRKEEKDASVPYYFRLGELHIRRIFVTQMQQELLARGRAAICESPDEDDVFLIVSEKAARTLGELCPNVIVCQHPLVAHDVELETD